MKKSMVLGIGIIIAVIVIVYLILMSLITCIGCRPFLEPQEEAVRIINTQISSPGSFAKSNEIKFSPDEVISASSVADRSVTLADEQVCFSSGDFADSANFVVSSTEIKFVSSSAFIARFGVLCSFGNSLEKNLNSIKSDWDLSKCSCIESENLCCVIGLIKK